MEEPERGGAAAGEKAGEKGEGSGDSSKASVNWPPFLLDVFVCSLGAYGGPEAHFGIFARHMVRARGYLSEQELGELVGLTTLLPGPSSTQTLVAIGYKVGGPLLAFLTLIVWALPVCLLVTGLTFAYDAIAGLKLSARILEPVGALAIAFVFSAAWDLGRKVLRGPAELVLWLVAAVVSFFFRSLWVFPLLLAAGAVAMVVVRRGGPGGTSASVELAATGRPPWVWLLVFAILAAGLWILGQLAPSGPITLLGKFYRYGYLIIGGGQVVVPYMYSEFVEQFGYLTSGEFLTGFGLVQGLPGPMFSFAAWAGGLASRGGGAAQQIVGGLVSALGIFLPGTLLVYFVYPLWARLRSRPALAAGLRGVSAVAVGLVSSAGLVLLRDQGMAPVAWAVGIVGFVLLRSRKVPAPVLVLVALVLGAGLYGEWG